MTFGGGNASTEEQLREFLRTGDSFDLNKYSNNLALGGTFKSNSAFIHTI